jgi:hypothetical protein
VRVAVKNGRRIVGRLSTGFSLGGDERRIFIDRAGSNKRAGCWTSLWSLLRADFQQWLRILCSIPPSAAAGTGAI